MVPATISVRGHRVRADAPGVLPSAGVLGGGRPFLNRLVPCSESAGVGCPQKLATVWSRSLPYRGARGGQLAPLCPFRCESRLEATLPIWADSTRASVAMASASNQRAAAASSTPNGVVLRARRRGLGCLSQHGPQHDPLSTRPRTRLYCSARQGHWQARASPHKPVIRARRGVCTQMVEGE